ncbi:DUF2787 domain-containing protein [Vibrio parahaemolyticus]|nr:DUF2787 domain-containing protein [Vibrio parahaemolyticus]MDF5024116.1 DUF2787 domain-containing protein [Vibrio parahaemolyticus]MDF5043383.1 DUF2787 domain-containing protein [Vibrio parahaemolyticus]MDF5158824.1 DUF2787 domain-containing protein [Vibrio parahaemolyticus]MDF5163637.1 DUF2787 domain-containing protein [Vibrio parahaemolyticus]MDF5173249.1 DUF2787 domain-containing protein [Vibrio parahaemolyticus]
MKLTFNVDRLPVSVDLQDVLTMIVDRSHKLTSSTKSLVINFRDSSYSAERGGYHPVEVRLVRDGEQWKFDYITDFSYVGYPYPELVKEIDFDFSSGLANFLYQFEESIADERVHEFYSMWETNFLSYVDMDAFDEIEVTVD